MEADFRKLLADHTALAALVGTRINPSTFTQGGKGTAIRYQKVIGTTGLTMQGSDGLSDATMQIDIRATTAAAALAVRDVLVTLLHPYRGIVGDTDFRLIELSTDRGVRFEKADGTDYYLASLDFGVWHASA